MFTDELQAHSKSYDGRLEPASLPMCSYDENDPGVTGVDDKYLEMYPTLTSFETSPCPSSTGVDGQDRRDCQDGGRPMSWVGVVTERGDGGMPFLARPLLGCEAGMDGSWLKPGKEAIAWLDLFYGTSNSLSQRPPNPQYTNQRPRCTCDDADQKPFGLLD